MSACEIGEKISLTRQTVQAYRDGLLILPLNDQPKPIGEAGRPGNLELVPPAKVPKRRLGTAVGLAIMIHAIMHIEFNAINLAWDAVYRFRDLPKQFYSDWITVASEEAHHFELLRKRLSALGYDYGDWPAHNGLWEMAVLTATDPLMRMALVPRILEARGLDVTPGIIRRLRQIGDEQTAAILEIILRDEIGHVAIGSRWFKYLCQQRGLDAERTFRELIIQHFSGQVTGPFHYEARQQAGFTADELRTLESIKSRTISSAPL